MTVYLQPRHSGTARGSVDGISILLVRYEASSDGFSMAVLAKYGAILVDTIMVAIEIDVRISVAYVMECFAEVLSSTVFE